MPNRRKPPAPRVLIVDDEALITELFSDMVEDLGLAVCGTAATADEAIALALRHRPDLVLMDVRLKGEPDGVHAGTEIHRQVGCPVVYITGSREPETLDRVRGAGPAAILIKPVLAEEFQATLRRALG